MDEVRAKAKVANPVRKSRSQIELDCLVDTGAVMLMLPKDVVEKH